MPAITFGGMASGLPPNIVERLIEAEKIPIKNIEAKKANSESRLELVTQLGDRLNEIHSSIKDLSSRNGFNDIKLESGDVNIVQGTVDPSSGVKGNWNIEVVQLAQKSAAITAGFPDKDKTEIGIGYFKFNTPDGTKEVYIDGNNNTLQGVVGAINEARIGIRASVINDRKSEDAPYKLILSGEGLGGDQNIEFPTLYFLDGDQDLYFEEERKAQNGIIKVDGFEFEISGNTVDDVIEGITLDLRQAAPGRQVTISVKEDREKVSSKMEGFVEKMNNVLFFIQKQNALNESSDVRATLGGDGILRSIETRLRRLIQGSQLGINGPIKRLNQIGIEFNRTGTLNYKEERFNKALASTPEAIQKFLSGDGFSTGFVNSLKSNLDTILNHSFGPIPVRKRALEQKIKRFDRSIENKEKQLAKKEVSLRRKFAKLEETMSRLKTQGGQLAAMSGSGGFSGPKFSPSS